MSDPPYSQPFVESIPSSINFKYIPGAVYAYAFSTIGNSLSQYNKDEAGTNLTTLSVNPVYTPPTGTTETLSLTNELLRWDNLAVGSLVVAGNVTKGAETAQVITCSGEVITVPNKLFINNLVDTNDFIGQEGYFLTTDSNSVPLWTNILPFPSTTVISTINTNYISSGTVVTDSIFFNNLNGVPLTSPIFANPSFSTIFVTQGAQISSLTVTQRLAVSPSTTTLLGATTTYANCSVTAGAGASLITTTGNHTATTGSFITNSGTVSSLTMSAKALTISSINALPVLAYTTPSAYTTRLLASALTTSAVPIASTIITTTTDGNILATANVSVQALTNQYHNTYLNLAINNQVSPSTFFSAPAGIGHYGNASLTFRATVSTGTYTVVAYQSAEASAVISTATVNLTVMGNLN